jgi:hypothetical protein
MPRPPVPPERTYRSRAALKRKAALAREADARRLHAEADLLERKWQDYIVRREAEKAGPEQVAS